MYGPILGEEILGDLVFGAIGSAEALMLKAADLGQRWMKGVSGELALKKLRNSQSPGNSLLSRTSH